LAGRRRIAKSESEGVGGSDEWTLRARVKVLAGLGSREGWLLRTVRALVGERVAENGEGVGGRDGG
jgi:hypothetical protein